MKNKKKKEAPKNNWMNTYADMVTLLFCFFVLLFAFSELDVVKFTAFAEAMAGRNVFVSGALGTIFNDSAGMMDAQSPPIPPRMDPEAPITEEEDTIQELISARIGEMEALAETFRTYMAPYDEEILADIGISVSELGEYVRVTFGSGMLFDSGQASLRPEAIEVIDTVASVINSQHPGHRIAVHGHTDNAPISTIQFPSNWQLSAARAISVMTHLMYQHGMNPALLEAVGMGEYRPIATNETAEGRAANRRVEILIFAQQQSITVITE